MCPRSQTPPPVRPPLFRTHARPHARRSRDYQSASVRAASGRAAGGRGAGEGGRRTVGRAAINHAKGGEVVSSDLRPLLEGFTPQVRCYLVGGRFWPYLSRPSLRIFDSSVWRGIPSFAAAPEGPDIRPWLSARAASIISTSRSPNVERPLRCDDSSDSLSSQLSSTTKVSVSLRITARSTTFCNSRIFPGQW